MAASRTIRIFFFLQVFFLLFPNIYSVERIHKRSTEGCVVCGKKSQTKCRFSNAETYLLTSPVVLALRPNWQAREKYAKGAEQQYMSTKEMAGPSTVWVVLLNTINSKRLQTNTVHSITNVLHDKQFVRVYVVKIFICQINLKKNEMLFFTSWSTWIYTSVDEQRK